MGDGSERRNGEKIAVLNPRGTPPPVTLVPMAPRLESLTGKTICIVDVNFPDTESFYEAAQSLLAERYPLTNWVVRGKSGSFFDEDPWFWAEIKEQADGVIVGPGHMDTLGPAVVGWCAKLEQMGVPAVPLICAIFPDLEKQTALQRGMPYLRIVYIPYRVMRVSVSDCRLMLDGEDPVSGRPVLDEIVEGLMKAPTGEEKRSGILQRPVPRLLEPDSSENLETRFLKSGWSDCLPIVLPTERRVAEMLQGTSHEPDEIVGAMAPCSSQEAWTYTVEQVAVNAVMAGAKPRYFPVILALAASGETSLWSSVTSQTRMAVVNGPIRRQIGMNSGMGALGPFNEANAVIGRSWTLVSKNLGNSGGLGTTYLGGLGNPMNYSNLCFAEDEEGLPRGWEPLHVEKGHGLAESVVSVFAGFGLTNDGHMKPSPQHETMRKMILKIEPFNFYRGVSLGLRATVLASPSVLGALVDEGFPTKESLKRWFRENLYKPQGDEKAEYPSETPVNIEIVAVGERKLPGCVAGEMYYVKDVSVDGWR